ncbi:MULTISPECIES: 30S ribosomal protein S6 [Alteribacter]|uniref:Small ribosomal subunit protein bS6 n=1 Tax=Alteribacter keqinensis TaxID=2483800 RepID=A0A3M7TR15_9BACI|nr:MULTISPECIES: 30S ribosomal protein S6 [Alteribacter]MBM7095382.1 30S ribosomal protein S6 [Alteribacter salitolerans]RNA68008.1 30S ribosomal protein S6 [Alteribacter keqinensis]
MRKYEIMYIVRPNLEEAATKEIVERYNKVLTDNGAEVEKVEEVGKKRLAYEIDDFNEGYYVILKVNSNPEAISEFDRLVKINENILRRIAVRDDE